MMFQIKIHLCNGASRKKTSKKAFCRCRGNQNINVQTYNKYNCTTVNVDNVNTNCYIISS